ncbi:MAG: hypothetical protein INR69_11885, partial [Mucilaginibacter polytrichastri]|nr:hypothetical protein [Mucilaginibacter polytrichastri]
EMAGPPRLNTIKSLFLTFKPLSVFGLLWAVLFYFVFIILSFLAMGFFMDDNSNFTMDALAKNLQDSDLMFGVVILFGALLLFRWLAVGDYRRRSARMAAKEEPAVNMNLSAA